MAPPWTIANGLQRGMFTPITSTILDRGYEWTLGTEDGGASHECKNMEATEKADIRIKIKRIQKIGIKIPKHVF